MEKTAFMEIFLPFKKPGDRIILVTKQDRNWKKKKEAYKVAQLLEEENGINIFF